MTSVAENGDPAVHRGDAVFLFVEPAADSRGGLGGGGRARRRGLAQRGAVLVGGGGVGVIGARGVARARASEVGVAFNMIQNC